MTTIEKTRIVKYPKADGTFGECKRTYYCKYNRPGRPSWIPTDEEISLVKRLRKDMTIDAIMLSTGLKHYQVKRIIYHT